MSIMQRQVELGRNLFQINTQTLRGFLEVQRENVEKYLELNRTYVERLPEVKDLGGFVALQRDYGETLWSGIRTSVQAQTDLVRDAFEDTQGALRTAFATEEEGKSTAKTAKPKAKKPAAKPAEEAGSAQ